MKASRVLRVLGALALLGPLTHVSCGDTTSDLITRGDAGLETCGSDADCPAESPRCQVEAGRCVQCLERADCGSDEVCTLPAATCIQACGTGDDCPSSAPVCDELSGLCRVCASDPECTPAAPFCQTGRCLQCREHADCSALPEDRFCDEGGRCVECTESVQCFEGEGCTPFGECAIACADEDDCNSEDPFCEGSIGNFCVECLGPLDCEDGAQCVAYECTN